MKIKKYDEKVENETTVVIGNFDGLHLGHIDLIKNSKKSSIKKGTKLVVITFCNKLTEMKSGSKKVCISSEIQRNRTLENLGVDIIYEVEFNEFIKNMNPEEFIKNVIIETLNTKEIYVGENFKFGKDKKGDISTLKKNLEPIGVSIKTVELKKINNTVISSSEIRKDIVEGNIRRANEFLGKPYSIIGKVIRGKGRGKKLGFATANIKIDTEYLSPKKGVYESRTIYNGKIYGSLTNIGENPTFGDIDFSIETHILDFDEDIYGKTIEIELIKYIREEVKFDNVSNLINQVKIDIKIIKEQIS